MAFVAFGALSGCQSRMLRQTVPVFLPNESSERSRQDQRDVWRLFETCKNGDAQAVQEMLLRNTALVGVRDAYDRTGLHIAKNADVAQVLISHGADPNATSSDSITSDVTPLHMMAERKDEPGRQIIELLLQHGADIHARANYVTSFRAALNGLTPLHVALRRRAPLETVELLLRNGAHVYRQSDYGAAPLDEAWNKEVLKLLREYAGCVGSPNPGARCQGLSQPDEPDGDTDAVESAR